MGKDLVHVAPVKILLKAFDTGIELSNSLLECTSSASTSKALQIIESVPNVKNSLERISEAIRDGYRQTLEACGPPFSQALLEEGYSKRLKELKNDLRDKIDVCSDYAEDPDSFDPKSFAYIQKESQKCYAGCVSIFNEIRTQNLELRTAGSPNRDDRSTLASMRTLPPVRKSLPPVVQHSQVEQDPQQSNGLRRNTSPNKPVKPKIPWTIDGAVQYAPALALQVRQQSRDISPSSLPQISSSNAEPQHIAEEVVKYQVSTNEEFLERRRQSKVAFQEQLRGKPAPRSLSEDGFEPFKNTKLRYSGAIDENRASEEFENRSTRPLSQPGSFAIVASPIDGQVYPMSPASYEETRSRQRSLERNFQNPRHSGTSSLLAEAPARQDINRQDSTTSQESIFGLRAAQSPPLDPPSTVPIRTGSINVEGLSATLKTPQFGRNVHEGIEVANGAYDFSSEKIFVATNDQVVSHRPTTASSTKSANCPMRHDTSFYLYRGFCEGAGTCIRARAGDDWYETVNRPLGNYNNTVSARCRRCKYEVGFNDLQKDKNLDPSGIYKNSGIRWRHRFITKSHLRAPALTGGIFACVFCVEEHKTVEDHDATVFFSYQELFRHLARHPQPLPRISGITVIYGEQPLSALDFDLHFTTSIPLVAEFAMVNIKNKILTRPSGHAAITHRPKSSSNDARDPDGFPVLQFAVGARIVGIAFPERFKSEWYSGYHNGEKGNFPASSIVLENPPTEEYMMSTKSNLVATAKWDFKLKDAKDAHWLKFSRGDRITCIGYTFPDSWCWSGQNSKGKWGIFPRAFVENLVEGDKLSTATSPPPRSSTFLSNFSLGRKGSRQDRNERSMSILSSSSGNSMGIVSEGQPGLEVATSPSQQVRTVGSWKS